MRSLLQNFLRYLAVTAFFAFIIVVLLNRGSLFDETTLPVKQINLQTVALFNAWTVWWNAHAASHGFAGYWNAPIFSPEKLTFACSDPQPATLMVAPFIWWGKSPAFAYRLYLFCSLLLNALVTMAIVRNMRRSFWLSVFAGTAMLLLPLVHAQLGVLQLVPIWGIVWTWGSAQKLARSPTFWRGLVTGLAFGSVFLSSVHHGLCLSILLTLTCWTLPISWKLRRFYGAALIAIAVGALITLPIVLPIRAMAEQHSFQRKRELVQHLSAKWSHYASLPANPLLEANSTRKISRHHLSPGWIKVSLAVFALIVSAVRLKCRRWTLFLLMSVTFGVLLSLGPNLHIGTWEPWLTFRDWCPGVAQVRSMYRFGYFAQIAVVLLAVEGLYALSVLRRRWIACRWKRITANCCLILVALAALLETWPTRPLLAGVPDLEAQRGWIAYLRDQSPAQSAVACIPFAQGHQVDDYLVTTRWMYYGTSHERPLVNGYSGFFPPSYRSLKQLIQTRFPSESVFTELDSRGVEFVVVLRAAHPPSEILSTKSSSFYLKLVYEDSNGVDIYRIEHRAL